MTEPPRPPGDSWSDPTAPLPPADPMGGSAPPPAAPNGPQPSFGYPPPTSGAGGYPPPTSGAGGYPPPTSGAGGYPPGGAIPPPYGYGPTPGYPGKAPTGYANEGDRTWALVAHFGGALGALLSGGVLGFVGPLIAYAARGQQSPAVRAHAVGALNFQILWSIIAFASYFVSWCLLFVPTLLILAVQIVIGIIAGVKASEGQPYRYPMSANFIK